MPALLAPQFARAPVSLRAAKRVTANRVAVAVPLRSRNIVTFNAKATPGSTDGVGSSVRGTSTALQATRNPIVVAASSAMQVVIPGDYRIGGVLLGVAALLGPVCHLWTQFGVHGFLGAFLTLQASRVRFRFSDTDLDVVIVDPGASDAVALEVGTESSGDNKLQGGGANKWSFESVVNWEFWFPGFPLLVYYKETQTKPEGQPHFFPVIMDGKKLYAEMLQKMPESVNKKPTLDEWNLDTAFEATKLGRSLKEKMSAEQLTQLKETTGFPGLDNLV